MQIQNALLTGSTTVYGPITFVSGSIIGSASYAQTSSYADTFTVAGSLTAQTLVVQTITSSVSFITGSTRFGSLLTNTHTFTGSLQVTGSGPHTVFGNVQMGNNTSVGTTTPVILSLGGTFNSGTAGSNVKLRVYESTSDGAIGGMSVSSGQMEINTWSSGRIAFYRGTTQTAVFDTGGSLGIGTATPLSRLHLETSSVSNGNILTLRNSAAWSTPMMTSIAIRDASNDVGAIGWRYNAAGTTVDMHIHSLYNSAYTNINNIVMTVRGNGNVGIGTVLPNASLHVSGSGSGSLMQISSHVSSSIFFVSGSGNIGIGTTTPSAKLEVNVGLNSLKISGRDTYVDSTEDPTNANIYVTQAGVGDFSQLAGNLVLQARTQGTVYRDIIFAGGLSNGDALMTILGEGNVGMGTNSPSYRLVVNSGIEGISAGISGATYGIRFDNGGTFSSGMSTIHGVDSTLTGTYQPIMINGSDVRFGTSATERMRITSAGSVGIGTTSPSQALHVSNASNYVGALINGSNAPQLCFAQGSGTSPNWKVGISGNDGNAFSVSSGSINADKLVILRNGNVGIGTFAPAYSLSVQSGWIHNYGAQNASGFRYENDASGHVLNMNANNSYAQLYTGTTTALYFGSNNILSLGINTSGHVIAITDNTYTMGASGNRWSAIWSANGTIQTSDEREKKDITNTDLGLDFVSKLRPVCYKWKVGQNIVTREPDGLDENGNEQFKIVKTPREGTRIHYGLIAQEVKQVLGDKDFGGYIHDEDTDIKGLRYDQFIAPLIKSIQELKAELEEATTRIKTLESK